MEEVNDDFSDFSLSSPATKIRRLDGELACMSEEEEMEVPIIEHYEPEVDFRNNTRTIEGGGSRRGILVEELPPDYQNQERAIVVFKPSDSSLPPAPSNFSVRLSPELISGFRNRLMCTYQESAPVWQADNGATERDEKYGTTNNCMAVVPWVQSAACNELSYQSDTSDMMDAEGVETTAMEVEDSNATFNRPSVREPGTVLNEGIHHWQQQHCMIPQLPQNTSTPIVWFR